MRNDWRECEQIQISKWRNTTRERTPTKSINQSSNKKPTTHDDDCYLKEMPLRQDRMRREGNAMIG